MGRQSNGFYNGSDSMVRRAGRLRPPLPRSHFVLSEKELRRSFDPKAWDRAKEYVGTFYECERSPREIRAMVDGNYGTYTTILRRVGEDLECACSCPAADDMDCKHAAALGLSYLRDPGSFKPMAKKDRTEVRVLADVAKFLKSAKLETLVQELQERGVTQKEVTRILGMNQGLFGSAKRLEKRGRRYSFLGACKLACAYLLGVLDEEGQPE